MIDYKEFASQYQGSSKSTEKNRSLLKERAQNKLAKIKEMMHKYMSSPIDAFDNFDTSRAGQLTYTDFSNLIIKLYKADNNAVPTYQVLKDLFDIIDIRKDGKIDKHEWNQTFANVSPPF